MMKVVQLWYTYFVALEAAKWRCRIIAACWDGLPTALVAAAGISAVVSRTFSLASFSSCFSAFSMALKLRLFAVRFGPLSLKARTYDICVHE